MSAVQSRPSQKTAMEALVGQVLDGRYRLDEVIARGAMGAVYKADQRPLDRPVAVKVLDPLGPFEEMAVFEERFLREASTLARLQHPNSVRVYDFGKWDKRTFLVMEYVDGYSLKRLLAGGPMPPARMVRIIMQMCGALSEAHSLGLIHRDLKPGNVLITRHAGALDVVKVVDFGLAKGYHGHDSDLTQKGQVLGTPMYMAPEQIRDEDVDPRVDIYALGVLLYRGVTGANPFDKGKPMSILLSHLHDEPYTFAKVNPSLDLPPVLEWVAMRCLEKEPENRFGSVMELRKALHACLVALEDPFMRGLEIGLEDGMAVLPDELTESSLTGGRTGRSSGGHAVVPAVSGTAPTIVEDPSLSIHHSLAAVGDNPYMPIVALAALFLALFAGTVAGVAVERLRGVEGEAAPAAAPAAVTRASAEVDW